MEDEDYILEDCSDMSEDDEGLEDSDEIASGFIARDIDSAIKGHVQAERPFECITMDTVRARQETVLTYLNELLQLKEGSARLLLRHCKWSPDRLQERYFEDEGKLMEETGVCFHSAPYVHAPAAAACDICLEKCDADTLVAIERCAHFSCTDCFGMYLAHSIGGRGKEAVCTMCPQRGCTNVCDVELVRYVLQKATLHQPYEGRNGALLLRYQELLEASFVDDNPSYQWCTAANCERIIHVPNLSILQAKPRQEDADGESTSTSLFRAVRSIHNGGDKDVRLKRPLVVACECGHTFCFACKEAAHTPAKCYMIQSWLRKQEDESETANWVLANTKPCPGCQAAIEKNEGCNHITCRRCGFNFCWVCEQEWSKHGSNWYKCNFYASDSKEKEEDEDKRTSARCELKRYIFYFTRYHNHERSKRLEKRVLENVERSIIDIQKASSEKLHHIEYLREAASQLLNARDVLKNSYVYAYYLQDGKEKSLFEYNQSQVEHNTECLSRLLEPKNRKAGTVPDREESINQSVLVKRSLERLQQGIFDSESMCADAL